MGTSFNRLTDFSKARMCAHASQLAYRDQREIEAVARKVLGIEEIQYCAIRDFDTAAFLLRSGAEVLISFRGTKTPPNFFVDADFNQVPALGGHVHQGFYEALLSMWPAIVKIIRDWGSKRGPLELCITGHSLGGALGLLAAMKLRIEEEIPVAHLITFGQPSVGNKQFGDAVLANNFSYLRFMNLGDYVPEVPPSSKTIWSQPGQAVFLNKTGQVEIPDPGTKLGNIIPVLIAIIQIVVANWTTKGKILPQIVSLFNMHHMELYLRRVKLLTAESAPKKTLTFQSP